MPRRQKSLVKARETVETVYRSISDADDHIGPNCPLGGYHAWYEPEDIELWKPGDSVLCQCICGKQMHVTSEDGLVEVGQGDYELGRILPKTGEANA
jgi:hypothetical protein